MTGAKDPKYARCRKGDHSPDPAELNLRGGDVESTCTVCGAELTVWHPEWDVCYPDALICCACSEAAPYCTCDGGPRLNNKSGGVK